MKRRAAVAAALLAMYVPAWLAGYVAGLYTLAARNQPPPNYAAAVVGLAKLDQRHARQARAKGYSAGFAACMEQF